MTKANGRMVIVIDDDAMMRQALESLLDANGLDARLFDSAEAAMRSTALEDASCVVTDIVLPGMSGFQLCDELSRKGFRLPIVFITAHDEPAVHEAAIRTGAVALFIKPFSGRALASAVKSAVHG